MSVVPVPHKAQETTDKIKFQNKLMLLADQVLTLQGRMRICMEHLRNDDLAQDDLNELVSQFAAVKHEVLEAGTYWDESALLLKRWLHLTNPVALTKANLHAEVVAEPISLEAPAEEELPTTPVVESKHVIYMMDGRKEGTATIQPTTSEPAKVDVGMNQFLVSELKNVLNSHRPFETSEDIVTKEWLHTDGKTEVVVSQGPVATDDSSESEEPQEEAPQMAPMNFEMQALLKQAMFERQSAQSTWVGETFSADEDSESD